MSGMQIVRSTPQMTIVETNILQRTDLSFTAKGIYAYYCSLDVGDVLTMDMLRSMPGPGSMGSVMEAGLDELINAGIISGAPE